MSQQVLAPPPATLREQPTALGMDDLWRLVEANARRWRTVLILEGGGLALSLPLAYLWLVFFLDGQLHLPVFGRLLASLG